MALKPLQTSERRYVVVTRRPSAADLMPFHLAKDAIDVVLSRVVPGRDVGFTFDVLVLTTKADFKEDHVCPSGSAICSGSGLAEKAHFCSAP